MDNSWYSFDVSPIWVFVSLIAALGAAMLLYARKASPWSKSLNVFMGFLRMSAVFLILLLLLNPLLQLNVNRTETPLVIMAVDNSESIGLRSEAANTSDVKAWIDKTRKDLENKYQPIVETLSGRQDTIFFDEKTTNLSSLLKRVEKVYENQNIGAVVLVSDGIINEGQSPAYQTFGFPVFTVGLGDTIPPRDIAIRNVRNNQVAYQGNQFPISILLSQKGYDGLPLAVEVIENGRKIAAQEITLQPGAQEVNFLLDAQSPGIRRLTIAVQEKEGESSYVNNQQDIYIDVIEGKDKILILAPAPHPDINAIRSVLNATSNYETVLYIPGIHERPTEKKFDAIIEHQAFSGHQYGDFESTGKWYIMGSSSNVRNMAQTITYLSISLKGNGKDKVRGAYNSNFSKFKISEELTDRLQNYPPIEVPFGEYQLVGPTEVLLYQQIGSITTERPLLVFFDDGSQKSAVTPGAGIWQWKLQEAGSEENSEFFEELILKTVQYLSIKVNKDRFVVKPRASNYHIGERVFMDTEVYNEIYERAYGNTIQLSITDENGTQTTYEMVDSPVNSSFNLGALEAGVYQFKATTTLGGKGFSETGSFAIRDIQLEGINLTADHNMLRSVAEKNDGLFYPFSLAGQIGEDLISKSYKSIIKTSKETFPLINSIWVILLIAGLLGTEWFLRKYLGAY
ncbi:MAG: hypothetical protein RIC30_06625 [Marinoscillum sp.]|uniref:hypothetical protein n=2 Tax=Marinoscillum sp. TaxID=2024838 RepID=UPI003300DE4A